MFDARDLELAAAIASALVRRGEKLAVGESSTGGLIAASLLTVPGASRFHLGAMVIYTAQARSAFFHDAELPQGIRGATKEYAELTALQVAGKLAADWAVAETGAAGPTGNRYGDPAGHSWVAVAGPGGRVASRHVLTGDDDRAANMAVFATAALELLQEQLEAIEA